MKNLFISAVLLVGLSMNVYGQKRPPAPPHPSKSELISIKSKELSEDTTQRKKQF